MTTLLELGEILTEAGETGRKIQTRLIGNGLWCDHTKGTYFDVLVYEYRLEPKIVLHERWVVLSDCLGCATEEEARSMASENRVMRITWETEE